MNRSPSLKEFTRNSLTANTTKIESKNLIAPPQPIVGHYTEHLFGKLPHFLGTVEDADGCESESELMMMFDSAHSCLLAEEHINSRR